MPEELTTSAAAGQNGISRPTLVKLIRSGELPATRWVRTTASSILTSRCYVRRASGVNLRPSKSCALKHKLTLPVESRMARATVVWGPGTTDGRPYARHR